MLWVSSYRRPPAYDPRIYNNFSCEIVLKTRSLRQRLAFTAAYDRLRVIPKQETVSQTSQYAAAARNARINATSLSLLIWFSRYVRNGKVMHRLKNQTSEEDEGIS